MKIRLLEAQLFQKDRQTERQIVMTKLTIPFRNFTKVPKSY